MIETSRTFATNNASLSRKNNAASLSDEMTQTTSDRGAAASSVLRSSVRPAESSVARAEPSFGT